MKEHICNICNKTFKQKSHLDKHLFNKIRPCSSINIDILPKNTDNMPKNTVCLPKNTDNMPKSTDIIFKDYKEKVSNKKEDMNNINTLLNNNLNVLLNIDPKKTSTTSNTCVYCNTTFAQKGSLSRHLKDRCKNKKNFDELEKLKEKMTLMANNYQNILKENENLKKVIVELKHSNGVVNNTKNINNGVINNNNSKTINNNVNVQLVQFGCENIDDIDTKEALKVYCSSTGGNILSNILKLINLNEKYPQNHNICISDLSRELVKIFDGKKFVIKKFKNIEGEIMYKVIRNTNKLVDKIENDDEIILSENILSKLRINGVSVKLINGVLAEDIVREEVRKKEKLLKNNDSDSDSDNEDIDENKERDFNLDERLRITHLQEKQQGLINISIERLKDELYNGKDLVENSETSIKSGHKKKIIII